MLPVETFPIIFAVPEILALPILILPTAANPGIPTLPEKFALPFTSKLASVVLPPLPDCAATSKFLIDA